MGKIEDMEGYADTHVFHMAIGNNEIRQEIGKKIKKIAEMVSVIHSTAYISPSAQIGAGSFIGIIVLA